MSFAEFATSAARNYFKEQKEANAGRFDQRKLYAEGYIQNINNDLRKLDKRIVKPDAASGMPLLDDIHLFPVLR